ncbi:unnamed protein product, partial [Mesorhabditis belari]
MLTEVKRDNFKSFWDKYSDKPDNAAMMLNHNAEDLEAADRADILQSLPNLKDKDAVDVGAGIGRFTTVLAETARWVLSTDFIESFIKKNQERNAHHGNIHYQVGDAVNLKMKNGSVDLVFTNWLMMYLSDKEVVQFLMSAMRWLRPNGYIHLRESCSEPSTGRAKSNTMHSNADSNPTHYRFSSLYIKLLKELRYRDPEGKVWRFDVQWSCSVPTYIKRMQNWRQIHWLTKKVPADGDEVKPFEEYLELFSNTWKQEQLGWDAQLDGEKSMWTDRILAPAINPTVVAQQSTVFVYTPRKISPFTHVNSHLLAEKFTCNVWNVEVNPWFYRTSITKANTLRDQRVRFGWNETLSSSVDYWRQRQGEFNSLVATELLATNSVEEIKELTSILHPEARAVLLEPVEEVDEKSVRKTLTDAGFKNISIKEVTKEAHEAQSEYLKVHEKPDFPVGKHWLLIEASL